MQRRTRTGNNKVDDPLLYMFSRFPLKDTLHEMDAISFEHVLNECKCRKNDFSRKKWNAKWAISLRQLTSRFRRGPSRVGCSWRLLSQQTENNFKKSLLLIYNAHRTPECWILIKNTYIIVDQDQHKWSDITEFCLYRKLDCIHNCRSF